VIALHPIHNIALLQYDPADLGELEVLSARLSSSTTPLEPGTTVYQIGLTSNERLVSQKSEILRVDPVRLASPNPPRFRESNVELYILREVAPSIGGVLTDSDGVVQALWTFRVDETAGNRFAGLPIDTVNELLRAVDRAGTFNPHDLGADLGRKSLVEARDQGLPDDWIAKLSNADPERRQAITIDRVHPQSALHDQTHGGALLLAIDDQPITRPRDVERAIAKRSSDTVQVTLFEAGEVRQFELAPFARAHQGVDRALLFAGALFHDQHPEVGLLNGTEPGGVYVAWYWYGTPAARSSVRASNIVRAVNGTPIADLQGLVEAVRDLKDGEAIRLAVETLDGVQKMATLETDLVYWPTAMVEYSDDEWRWRLLESSAGSESSADDRP
jgi:S1-C subfamily serine protease